ncbi:hypothetical protein A2U01_0039366 [Trifolium medium]|uniref:Transmembrane protein n=1 Tax=Trifolium medium TaxID=97028 RepID=A0A392Q1D0_9FABA|nr:hypothetical protein [Trifolium medium]
MYSFGVAGVGAVVCSCSRVFVCPTCDGVVRFVRGFSSPTVLFLGSVWLGISLLVLFGKDLGVKLPLWLDFGVVSMWGTTLIVAARGCLGWLC